MTVNLPLRIELTLQVLEDGSVTVSSPPTVELLDATCPAVHPSAGRCALPAGHEGPHDTETAGAGVAEGEAAPAPASEGGGSVVVVDAPGPPPTGTPGRLSGAQRSMIFAALRTCGYSDEHLDGRDERLRVVSGIVGRPVASTNDLTKAEARRLIDALGPCLTRSDVEAVVEYHAERVS